LPRVVHKYPIPCDLWLPVDSDLRFVAWDSKISRLCVWVEHEFPFKVQPLGLIYSIKVVATGGVIPAGFTYLGTGLILSTMFWHVYYKVVSGVKPQE